MEKIDYVRQIKYESFIAGVTGTLTVDQVITYQESIADGASDLLKNIAQIQTTGLQIIAMDSGQDMTVKTNSSSTPDDTYNLKAGKPMIWITGVSFDSNPVSADIDSLYITNSSGSASVLKILAGYNA